MITGHIQPEARELLAVASLLSTPVEVSLLHSIVSQMGLQCSEYQLEGTAFFQWDVTGKRLFVPEILKCVIRLGVYNFQELCISFFGVALKRLQDMCTMYHTKDPFKALSTFWQDYDNIIGAILTAIHSLDVNDLASCLTHPQMCLFLHRALEPSDYQLLYKELKEVVDESMEDDTLRAAVVTCMAYHFLEEGEYSDARLQSEAACNQQKDNTDPLGQVYLAFSLLCLGRACWKLGGPDEETGMAMVKKSMDILKLSMELQNSLTLFAYEYYAAMHKEKGSLMRARHYYNVIDFALGPVTDQIPFMQQGYNNRRSIWEKMGLYQWAADAARKAAGLADKYYGEHPITGDMYMKLCDCLIKTGETREALGASLNALGIRQRVLGRHLDTALAHKAAAYLLLRAGYYQEAVDHGRLALDICHEVGAHERYSVDTETIITQGEFRLRQAASYYVHLDTHNKGQPPIIQPPPDVDYTFQGSSTQV